MKYRTNDLAKILGVTTNTIRRYEKNGYITPEKSTDSGYRSYTQGDILKIGLIRLLRKCGFTHYEIEECEGRAKEDIRDIAKNKLNELDEQIQRLKFLRHWLKDNIAMIDTCKILDTDFTIMDCPPVYYVLYSNEDKLLTEKERLKTITDFMYAAPEVQSIKLISEKTKTSSLGWAIKEMDIERVGLHDIFKNNKYIKYYALQKCIYTPLRYPSKSADAPDMQAPYIEELNKRKEKFLQENNFAEKGDTMLFFLGSLGENTDWMVCIPVAEK